jgi:hypothetical protein
VREKNDSRPFVNAEQMSTYQSHSVSHVDHANVRSHLRTQSRSIPYFRDDVLAARVRNTYIFFFHGQRSFEQYEVSAANIFFTHFLSHDLYEH